MVSICILSGRRSIGRADICGRKLNFPWCDKQNYLEQYAGEIDDTLLSAVIMGMSPYPEAEKNENQQIELFVAWKGAARLWQEHVAGMQQQLWIPYLDLVSETPEKFLSGIHYVHETFSQVHIVV